MCPFILWTCSRDTLAVPTAIPELRERERERSFWEWPGGGIGTLTIPLRFPEGNISGSNTSGLPRRALSEGKVRISKEDESDDGEFAADGMDSHGCEASRLIIKGVGFSLQMMQDKKKCR
ncbi:hypothetical protein AVEN_258630-1 [Araneus ventricosus]|uniref:Uncharacterized protein n=1 Tax=Araneus ventricosus TaxID=182803 RepID=A0A4Y2HMS1_ARAVE|nr:hypothetical protein AVEN_258630-1 [Araneus ventricosus]